MQSDSKQRTKKETSGPTETWAAQDLYNWGVQAIWTSPYHKIWYALSPKIAKKTVRKITSQ